MTQKVDLTRFKNKITVTAKEMAEIDSKAIESGVTLEDMMESAGKQLAHLTVSRYPEANQFLVLVGGGHNGGGGLVAARYLKEMRKEVSIFLTSKKMRPVTKLQYNKALKVGVGPLTVMNNLGFDCIIDAILGYSIHGKVVQRVKIIIKRLNKSGLPIIALDIPSGLDPDTGKVLGIAVEAEATLTLAAIKRGFLNPATAKYLGQVYLADIGIPRSLFKSAGSARI